MADIGGSFACYHDGGVGPGIMGHGVGRRGFMQSFADVKSCGTRVMSCRNKVVLRLVSTSYLNAKKSRLQN